MIIIKALYGLKSSGLRWHERFSAVLKEMGFFQCYSDPDVWMKHMGGHYEYIGVYVDDLEVASKDPAALLETLTGTYKFKLKGTGPMTYHLGCDFLRDPDGTLVQSPRKCVEKMVENYTRMFNTISKPKKLSQYLYSRRIYCS